eukprot:TRINITY_DN647_c0_g1_i14.p1 TRINITY_DN647_c0_g1~~TRINITY_DN647_c0_g1_i14.p1  ORF type:complete len:313 (+),score=3.49 TRINITY_DN647_c0_g1_i14:40-978(+)
MILIFIAFVIPLVDSSCFTTGGDSCVFPFIYNGVTYAACTTIDNGNNAWCATSVNTQNEYTNYGDCSATGCQVETTATSSGCATTNGKNCVFPFMYNGVSYSTCTTVDFGNNAWCATSLTSSGESNAYGLCSSSCPLETTVAENECGTIDSFPCVFPFTYSGTQYFACTTVENYGTPWCATQVNPTTNELTSYSNCNAFCGVNDDPITSTTSMTTTSITTSTTTTTSISTTSTTTTSTTTTSTTTTSTTTTMFSTPSVCATTSGRMCVFPFKYNGVTYNACTNEDFGTTNWCATAVDGSLNYQSYGICGDSC